MARSYYALRRDGPDHVAWAEFATPLERDVWCIHQERAGQCEYCIAITYSEFRYQARANPSIEFLEIGRFAPGGDGWGRREGMR